MVKSKRISEKEYQYVSEVLDNYFRTSSGSIMSTRLEKAFAEKFNIKYAISHINGTATLHSALAAAGIGSGDEVIVPPLTMSSTAFAVLHENAVPVFSDIDPDTFLISPEAIDKVITSQTKGIITVALYGLSPDMDSIMKIADQHNLVVIEDDAQCFLGKYKGKIVGSIGHMASFSFQNSKHITSGEGGMLITKDEDLANKIRRFSSLGYAGIGASKGKITKIDIQDPDYERHVSLGWNYRMPELCAAVALGQLENIDKLVQRRIDVAQMYDNVIKKCDWLTPQFVPEICESSYWTYAVRFDHPSISWHEFRDQYLKLGGDGIYAAWQLTYLEPVFRSLTFGKRIIHLEKPIYSGKLQKYAPGLCPVAEEIQPKMLQFKTNYWDLEKGKQKVDSLAETIEFFNGFQ